MRHHARYQPARGLCRAAGEVPRLELLSDALRRGSGRVGDGERAGELRVGEGRAAGRGRVRAQAEVHREHRHGGARVRRLMSSVSEL